MLPLDRSPPPVSSRTPPHARRHARRKGRSQRRRLPVPTNEALRKYLRENRIDYSVLVHPLAMTAQEVAAAVRVTGYELAKVVVLRGKAGDLMAVLPAPLMVDVEAMREFSGDP